MIKRIAFVVAIVLICMLLSGCWSYSELETLNIVSGIAVDKDFESGNYKLTFEIIDIRGLDGSGGSVTKYVESEGDTLFVAIRNSKKLSINRFYGGNLETLIISKQIAEKDGVNSILEELLRVGEHRETMCVAVSQGETAKEILMSDGIDSDIIAFEIHDMIEEDNAISASTKNMTLYQAYIATRGTGTSLVLPAIKISKNNDKNVATSNGVAVFKEDFLVGFENAEDTLYYLLILNETSGGAVSFAVDDSDKKISLDIKKSKSKTKVLFENNQTDIYIDIEVDVKIAETKSLFDITILSERDRLEKLTAQVLGERTTKFFKTIQSSFGIDIFGFGRQIYQRDPNLWRSIESEWHSYFEKANVYINVTANIISTGDIDNY